LLKVLKQSVPRSVRREVIIGSEPLTLTISIYPAADKKTASQVRMVEPKAKGLKGYPAVTLPSEQVIMMVNGYDS
jgi:hypothetical protein